MPAKAISLADIPDMEEDLDLGGLPSWNSKAKPASAATKPASAATKPAATASSGSSGSSSGSNYASKYAAQEEAAAKYGAGSTSYSSASSSGAETAAQRASRYGGGAYKPEEESAPSKYGGSKYTPSEEPAATSGQRGARYGGGAYKSEASEEDTSAQRASKYGGAASSYSSAYQPRSAARAPEPEPEPEYEEAEEEPASAIDVAPLDMDERNRLAAEIEQGLTLESMGIPNFRQGDYGSAAAGRTRVVDKGIWTASTNTVTGGPAKTRAQLLREGKEVLSIREQKEAEEQAQREEAAAAALKARCISKGCTFQAVGKRGYCATHQLELNQKLDAARNASASSPRSTPGSAQYQPAPKHKCAACKQGIIGDVVEALNAHWHETCFCCRGCGAEFPSGKFVNVKGQPHCRACAAAASGAEAATGGSGGNCNGCRRPIGSEGVEAMGASWHKQCFVCTYCRKPFVSGKFSSVKGEPFCNQQCFEARLGI